MASGRKYFGRRQEEPPPIYGDFPLDKFKFIRPGLSAEQRLRSWDFFLPDIDDEQKLRNYRPWPGNWQDIVIKIGSDLVPPPSPFPTLRARRRAGRPKTTHPQGDAGVGSPQTSWPAGRMSPPGVSS